MKKVSVNLLTNVILLLAGIILIIFHNVPNVLIWGSRIMGATFLLPAIAYLVMVAVRHADARTSTDYLGVLPAVGGLCFGLVMMIKPDKFDEILQLLLGVLLVALGLFHIIYLMLSRGSLNIKGWYFLSPAVVTLCGVLSLAVPSLRGNVQAVVLISGICLLLFNFTSLQEYLVERRVRRAIAQPTDNQVVEDHPVAVDDNVIKSEQ
jgi:peptidoglycan/LPS O-acetylase OafA/YrhL